MGCDVELRYKLGLAYLATVRFPCAPATTRALHREVYLCEEACDYARVSMRGVGVEMQVRGSIEHTNTSR